MNIEWPCAVQASTEKNLCTDDVASWAEDAMASLRSANQTSSAQEAYQQRATE